MASVIDPSVLTYFSQADSLTKDVFATVAGQSAVSGWALLKALNQGPEEIKSRLDALRQSKLVESDGEGLDGIYHLTSLGYLSRDVFGVTR